MKLPLLLQLLPLLSRPDMTALPPIVCCIVLPLHFLNRAWTTWLLQLGRCPVDLPPQPPRTFVCLEILIRCRSILYSQTFVLQRRGPSPATNSSPTLKLFFRENVKISQNVLSPEEQFAGRSGVKCGYCYRITHHFPKENNLPGRHPSPNLRFAAGRFSPHIVKMLALVPVTDSLTGTL